MKQVNFFRNVVVGAVLLITTLSVASFAQLSGVYTVGGTSPDYATLSAAISALNSQGVNGSVTFNIRDGIYTGSSWQGAIGNISGASSSNTITFQSQSGNSANCTLRPTGSSSANYVFYFNGCKYVTVRNLTLENASSSYGCDIRIAGAAQYCAVENCVLTGYTGSTTSTNMSRVYGTSLASSSNMDFKGNTINRGAFGVYLQGGGTSSLANNYTFEDNKFTENYYYWAYLYYMGDLNLTGNNFSRSGAASSYFYGVYTYYTGNSFIMKSNLFNNSCNAYYNYCGYFYTSNYITQNKTSRPEFVDNTINMNTGSSTYYNYPWYNYYTYYGLYKNNTFNINSTYTSGYVYLMYAMYYSWYCKAEGNTYNVNKADGYVYTGMYYGTSDTFTNNTINVTGNSYCYNYLPYYTQDYVVTNNNISLKSTNRTMYGAYAYQYDGIFANNIIDVECTSSGTIYGLYPYYSSGKFFNNVVYTKTTGANYTCRPYYCYKGCKLYNNTFYSAATGSTNYTLYAYITSSSYDVELKNNIIARSGTNGYLVYTYNSDYSDMDHNLFSAPGGNYFQRGTPSFSTNALADWRLQTDLDKNSLKYVAPFNNAGNKDFSINANAPGAWAVNGRSLHDTSIATDITGASRPLTVQAGVPDIGAYEVTPTSMPPNVDAVPINPVANSTQVFTFGEDTVATVDWGATVPSAYTMRQYTGVRANPMPLGVGRMYFYTTVSASAWIYDHKPHVYYKDNWIGDVSNEANAVIARSSNGGAWEGYNYTNAATDPSRNTLAPAAVFDSLGAYTGVENGRIGIRCVESPKGLTISGVTAFDAQIDWAPVFNPIGYQVVHKKVNVPPTETEWNNAGITPTNTQSYSALDEDTKYYVFVRSICGVKDTSGYTADSFVTIITCHEPTISISALNNSRAVVSWSDIKTAVKYEYVLNEDPNAPGFGMDLTKTSVLASYLDANKQYYVHVRAHCNTIYSTSSWKTEPFKTWPTGISNLTDARDGISLFPNPASAELNVLIAGGVRGNAMIEIFSVDGKLVYSQPVDRDNLVVDLSGISNGVYMLHFTDGDRKEQTKFVKN